MKRTPGMSIESKEPKFKLPKIDCHSTISTLNEDSSDKGLHPDNPDVAYSLKTINNLDKAVEAPFHMQCEKLSRPFIYLKKINAQDRESKFKRMNGELNKNIPNNIWAADLAHEVQYIMLCNVKRESPATNIRDDIIVSSTDYMAKIFEQILSLFEDTEYYAKFDIGVLFELLIEQTYRLESIITPREYENVNFGTSRKILYKFRDFVLEFKSVESVSDLKHN